MLLFLSLTHTHTFETYTRFSRGKRALAVGPLTSRQIFRFSEEGLVNARFDYSYNNFRVTSMQAVINETPLPIDLYRYVDVAGRVEQFGKFSVIFYDLNQVGGVVSRGRRPAGPV